MTFDDIKEMQIGSKKVKEAWLNGRQVYPSEKRIMDSLVCWYDPGKQQCTNESMAANPVLADLSGNGHDIECFNFGWAGMSGIGGYKVNFNEFKVTNNDSLKEHTYNKLVVYNTEDVNTNFWDFFNNLAPGETYHIDSYKVRISGLSDGETIKYRYYNLNDDNSTSFIDIRLRNGINTIPEINMTSITGIVNKYTATFLYTLNEVINKQITIELLPEYPNALVSDGVDDYCYTEGMPILTDYTVIAKRIIFTDNSSADNNACIATKGRGGTEHAFIFERLNNKGNFMEYNFGGYNSITLHSDEITYCTKNSYNGQSIIAGTSVDNDSLKLYSVASGSAKLKAALYSFLLFDRTLTTAEIEWVKKNMVEGDLVLPSYELDPSLIDAWIFSGLRNEDAPASIVGEKGIELKCYNFAWNEEGSGFKDGALCFDGVDDSCAALDKLACDRNVTVIGKRRLTSAEYNQWQTSLNIHIDNSLPNILYLDYYEDTFEPANGHKLKCIFGDYEYYYDNDTEPHSFWATKDAFNGQAYNNKVYNSENGLKYSYNIYLGSVWSGAVAQCEWYYFAIYDKVMTEKEAQAEIKKLEKIWSNRKNN